MQLKTKDLTKVNTLDKTKNLNADLSLLKQKMSPTIKATQIQQNATGVNTGFTGFGVPVVETIKLGSSNVNLGNSAAPGAMIPPNLSASTPGLNGGGSSGVVGDNPSPEGQQMTGAVQTPSALLGAGIIDSVANRWLKFIGIGILLFVIVKKMRR